MSFNEYDREKRWGRGNGRPKPIERDIIYRGNPIGANLDEVYDSGKECMLTLHNILDLIAIHDKDYITISFDKEFLKKILKSHISQLREINAA